MNVLDVKAIEADLDQFMPLILAAVKLVPGLAGNELANLLTVLTSHEDVEAVVSLLNARKAAPTH